MSDFINGIKSGPYRKEMIDTLQKLVKGMPAYKEFVFFVKCVRDYYLSDFEKNEPDIAVIGSGIPEELVLASGKRPYWIAKGTLPIIGVTKVKQVEEAAKAVQISLTAEEVSRLEKLGDETGVHTLREWEKEM